MMNPQQDWQALDNLSEAQAKMLLRMAVAQFRMIKDTVKNPLDEKQYSLDGHALALGSAMGFLVSWEDKYDQHQPKSAPESSR